MANFFTNEDIKVVNTTGQYGFVASSLNATDIVDNSMHSMNSLSRMVSSIPTPFARLFMFSGAFEHLNKFQNDNPDSGYNGLIDEQKKKLEPTIYHYLVSECLDLIEFIFKNGNRPEFHVSKWNVQSECQKLLDSGQPRFVNLGKALLDAHKYTMFNQTSDILLFSWGESEDISKRVYLGGTSPASLVYTSANLIRNLKDSGFDHLEAFQGDGGNEFFVEQSSVPLYKRSKEFRIFMYQYHRLDICKFIDKYVGLNDLATYIRNIGVNYDKELWEQVIVSNEYSGIKELKSKGELMCCGNIPLYRIDDNVNLNGSDYILAATVSGPYKELVNGEEVSYENPLFLTNIGAPKLIYGKNREWKIGNDKIPNILKPEISTRRLPGFGQEYPYLTIDDFLESKIIEVSYNIDSKNFFTGNKGEIHFLLPLKKEFFKYFEISDLVSRNGSYSDMIQIKEVIQAKRKVVVIMNIPLVNNHKIEVYKEYYEEDIIDCFDKDNTFDFALFPFYKVVNNQSDNGNGNVYNLMLGTTINELDVHFYAVSDIRQKVKNIAVGNVKSVLRSDGDGSSISTKHIHITSEFDIIEFSVGEYKAIAIPRFKDVNVSNATNVISYCIDFGTTNTHIVYSLRNRSNATNAIGLKNIKTLDITQNDVQVVTFHGDDGPSEFVSFLTAFKREFVPLQINNGCNIHYPMRTSMCQLNTQVSSLELFSNTNIGFNYDEEIVVNSGKKDLFTYKTDIKWNLKDILSSQRIREYFTEILWIMKNKALLNDADDQFEIIATYPQAMRSREKNAIVNAWQQAKVKSGCKNVIVSGALESVTPYYAYLSSLAYNSPYVNFDIGGGTTDILYVNPTTGESISLSAFFAANDLWGDGVKEGNEGVSNGFIVDYDNSEEFNLMSDGYKTNYKNIKLKADKSEDVINYLFVHDDITNFSTMITKSDHFELLFVHFASLIYYMAYAIDILEIECPKYVTFTGMGSQYIKLISSNENEIAKLIESIFKFYSKHSKMELERPTDGKLYTEVSVVVKFSPQPKIVTAQGGLVMRGHKKPIMPESVTVYGYENEEFGKAIRGSDVAEIEGGIYALYNDFLELFKEEDIKDILGKLDMKVSSNLVGNLGSFKKESMKAMKDMIDDDQKDKIITEPLYFWLLKNTLYRMTRIS